MFPLFFKNKSAADIGGLVVGLGNPGPKYVATRHNMGFMAVEALLNNLAKEAQSEELAQGKKFQSLLWRCHIPGAGAPWLVVMPQTFMNLSGEAVQPLMAWYKLSPHQLLVVHDELDLPPGRMMLKSGGGLAGHNGLKSIAGRLGDNSFHRLRLGIGRPPASPASSSSPSSVDKGNRGDSMTAWVTGRFSPADAELVHEIIPRAADAVLSFIQHGPVKTAESVNSQKKKGQVS